MNIKDLSPEQIGSMGRGNKVAGKKKSKMGNKRVKIDDHKFDSIRESEFYLQCKFDVQQGNLAMFLMQVSIPVIRDKAKEKWIKYKVDFITFKPGFEDYVEFVDVKGRRIHPYQEKKAAFEDKYPEKIREI